MVHTFNSSAGRQGQAYKNYSDFNLKATFKRQAGIQSKCPLLSKTKYT